MLSWLCFFLCVCTSSYTSISKFPARTRVILSLSLISQQDTSLITQQFVVTHKIHQTEIPTFLDSWVTTLCPQTIVCPHNFVKKNNMLKCWSTEDIGQLFLSIPCETVCREGGEGVTKKLLLHEGYSLLSPVPPSSPSKKFRTSLPLCSLFLTDVDCSCYHCYQHNNK